MTALGFTHLENRFWINGFESLRGRPGVRGVYHRARVRVTRRLRPGYAPCLVKAGSPDGAGGSRECASRRCNPGPPHRCWMPSNVPNIEKTHDYEAKGPVKISASDSAM